MREYVEFYDFILKNDDRVIIVTFEELTQNTRGFLERLIRETGLEFLLDNVEDLKERAMHSIREWQMEHGIPEKSPLPLEDREERKMRIQQEIRNCRYYPDAVVIWQQVIQRVKP